MRADVGDEPVVLFDISKRQVFQRSVNGQQESKVDLDRTQSSDEVLPLVATQGPLKKPPPPTYRFWSTLLHMRAVLLPILRPRTVLSVLNQLTWIIVIQAWGSVYEFPGVFSVVLGLLSLLALHELPAFLLGRSWVLLAAADWFIIMLSSILSVYRFKTGFFLDYNVIHLNVGLITYGESFSAVPVGSTEAIAVALSYPILLWVVLRRRLDEWYKGIKPGHVCVRFLRALGMGLLLYSVLFGETHTTDSMTEIFRSMLRVDPLKIAVMDVDHLTSMGINVDDPFPLLRKEGPVPAAQDGNGPLPHIIVVALESYNSRYLFKNCSTCDPRLGPSTEFTPHMNRFARENSYSTKFYGNSVQTARSHVAMHCGILPSWRGKIFTDHSSLNVRCLPRILGEVGYHSLFWSTQESLSFDNEGPAMRHMVGFERAESMNAGRARDKTKEWGMGWQDDESYHAFFQYLDAHMANDTMPWYSFITTVSHHMHFDRVPDAEKRLFPHVPKHSMRQKFEDSIHAADRYFGDFLSLLDARPWLQDAIVIVLGDHSYPNGEHSNFYNDFGGFEENFRVPLAIRVPASLKGRMGTGPLPVEGGSQVDLPPTVLDLLQVRTTHSFFGFSLLAKQVDDTQLKGGRRPTVMVQPYAGVYFIAVRWPYKLRFDFQTKKHVLTDLEQDPDETHNLYGAQAVADIQELLQRDLSVPLISQQLIQANRVYPVS